MSKKVTLGQGWAKGKTYEVIYGKKLADKKRKFLSNCSMGVSSWAAMSATQKIIANNKRRKSIQIRYANGWRPGGGRCKKIKYISPFAGEVTLDGTWELIVARYLDLINIKWERNTKRFPYIKKSGVKSYYVPDFYVKDWKTYIEIKGMKLH